jgi:hypothetical protein
MLERPNNARRLSRQPWTHHRDYRKRRHAAATLRAFAGARLLRGDPVQPKTQAAAARLVASTPQYIAAATALLEAEASGLIERVLQGDIALLEAAETIRKRARLVKAYRQADKNDRKALGKVVGVDIVFDETVVPHL